MLLVAGPFLHFSLFCVSIYLASFLPLRAFVPSSLLLSYFRFSPRPPYFHSSPTDFGFLISSRAPIFDMSCRVVVMDTDIALTDNEDQVQHAYISVDKSGVACLSGQVLPLQPSQSIYKS